ncbi:MAG: glycosyltransferase family 4 protein [Gemmatimonadota bacterium]
MTDIAEGETPKSPAHRRPLSVVVVGQTPPPVHGQSVMIAELLNGRFDGVELHHVPMRFSERIEDVAEPSFGKVLRLLPLLGRILGARIRYRADVLYYPPAGPRMVPVLRDLAVLIPMRPLFRHTVFHFHAGGLSTVRSRFRGPFGLLWRAAYMKPDVAIRISVDAPPDGEAVRSRREVIVANGIHDPLPTAPQRSVPPDGPLRLLSLGMQSWAKGTMVLLRACRRLAERGTNFHLTIGGSFETRDFQEHAEAYLREHDLESHTTLAGVLTGPEKWQAFRDADVFCFPSQHEGETFGIVLLEAFAFSLPVVASRWSGIPAIVPDGDCGLLFPVGEDEPLADALARLSEDPALRAELGARGRARFLAEYTVERHLARMQAVFDSFKPA